ncbi:MAG: O-antigen ligase family protein [Elusimicrobia bacterium]|nr:O-antigen ligase family protein [Elusimicrobiota bacterium]
MELVFNYIFSVGIIFSHVIGYIISALAFLLIYKHWNYIKKEKIVLFITAFLIYGFLWIPFCDYQKEAAEEMFTYLTSWLFPFVLGYFIVDNIKKEQLVKIYISVFVVVLFVSVLSYFGLFYERFIDMPLAIKEQHLQGNLWHISCGAMCVLLSCFTLIPLMFKENLIFKQKVILFLMTIFFMICLYLTGSRGYYIAGFITYLFMFAFYIFKTKKFKIPLIIFILCAVIIAVLFSNNKFMRDRIENTSITKEWSLTNRLEAYEVAVAIFKDNFVLGVGPRQAVRQIRYYEQLNIEKKDSKDGRHMHSMYFNLVADFGTIGFVLFCVIIFLIFKRLYISYKKEGSILALCLLFAWISLLIGDCFDTVLRGPRVAMDYFWLTGLFINKDKI